VERKEFFVHDFMTGMKHNVSFSVLRIGMNDTPLREMINSMKICPDVGKDICAVCGKEDLPVICVWKNHRENPVHSFRLQVNWKKMYNTSESKKRVLWALGIALPKKQKKNNHSHTTISLLDKAIELYEKLLSEHNNHEVAVREVNNSYLYENVSTEIKYERTQTWVQCGVNEGELGVPPELQKFYCGKWYHPICIGCPRRVNQKVQSKDKENRIACLDCLRDKRHIPKVPIAYRQYKMAMYTKLGTPRIIVDDDRENNIKTLFLDCDCGSVCSIGLPCVGMCKVAQTTASVLHYRLFNKFW
jgi:hypothetical protein